MSEKISVRVNMDKTIVQRIDSERGDIPRSTYINDLLYWGVVATDADIDNIESFGIVLDTQKRIQA
jgi:hypothetical protein